MIESDHHPSLHVDFGKLQPKLASYVNYLFATHIFVILGYMEFHGRYCIFTVDLTGIFCCEFYFSVFLVWQK